MKHKNNFLIKQHNGNSAPVNRDKRDNALKAILQVVIITLFCASFVWNFVVQKRKKKKRDQLDLSDVQFDCVNRFLSDTLLAKKTTEIIYLLCS